MDNYKMTTLMKSGAGLDMEFTAKDDLAAIDIATKFSRANKALGYKMWRKAGGKWHIVCTDELKPLKKTRC